MRRGWQSVMGTSKAAIAHRRKAVAGGDAMAFASLGDNGPEWIDVFAAPDMIADMLGLAALHGRKEEELEVQPAAGGHAAPLRT